MSTDTRQRVGWVRISSDPRSPIGFCDANRQIGCYENDTDDSESDGSLPGATMARFHDALDTAKVMSTDTRQRFGWVRISSDPRSPIGFCDANRQIGCYENDTDDSESDGSLPGATMARFHDASDTANELRPNTHSTDKVTGAKGTPRRRARSDVVNSETRPVPHAAMLPDGAPQSTTDGPIAKECGLESWLERDALIEKTTGDHQPPNPVDVLQYMIQQVGVRHSERYGAFLASGDRASQLEKMILPKAWDILKSRDYSRLQLLQLPQDVGPEDGGIYLHILWQKLDPDHFYQYVGQSIKLQARIRDHRDPLYRARHRSLHYHVWDYFPTNGLEIEEHFVFLSIIKDDVDPLLLNLLEFWCCLMLQTLTKSALETYLPPGVLSPQAGQHLNVALPIHQSAQGEAVRDSSHGDIYHSSDPLVREYYSSLRNNHSQLKYSPNPLIRQCYQNKLAVQHKKSGLTKRNRSARKMLGGMDVPVRFSKGNRKGDSYISISVSYWMFRLSRQIISVEEGNIVRVQFHISHPMCKDRYATKSLPTDPASRLKISIEGVSAKGERFLVWLQSTGEMEVFRMNTLVDMLENLNIHDPSHRTRRWIPNSAWTRRRATYTTDVLEMLEKRRAQAKNDETDEDEDA